MLGLIYEEVRGVMKQFLEAVVKDAIIFTQYCHWRTVTPVDVIFTLKQHGRNVYGFTWPYSYSTNVKNLTAQRQLNCSIQTFK